MALITVDHICLLHSSVAISKTNVSKAYVSGASSAFTSAVQTRIYLLPFLIISVIIFNSFNT
jgi:spore maturation protein SpmB